MINNGKAALVAAALITMMSCTQKNETQADNGYIGPSDIKIEDGRMTPEALLSLGRLSDPQLSPDGHWILYGVSYTSIEENRSCRNLFLGEVIKNDDGLLSFGDKIQLTAEGKSVSNARWSLDGKSIYYLQGGQLYNAAISIVDGKASLSAKKQLSDVKAGIGEFSLSPDQTQVLYTSTIPGAVKTPKDFDEKLDKAQAYVTEDLMYRHWDHWTTERPQTYVAPLGAKVTEDNSMNILAEGAGRYELPLEPMSGIEQLCWSPDGHYVAYSCKKVETGREYAFSTDTEIYIYSILTGETVQIPMAGGYDTDPVWSPDGKQIAWLSMERNGYEADKVRLMVAELADAEASSDGQSAIPHINGIRDLTADFKYNAGGPVWAADSKSIYFNSLIEGLQAICNVKVADSEIKRITPDDAWYDFNSPFAIVDSTLLASYCSMEFPTELVAVNETDGSFSRITDENGGIIGQLTAYETRERWIKTTDGKKMLTWVLYPPKFDSTKVYPAIEIFLGGPQGTLSQGWSYRWNYRLMANQGYIVILPNRRGRPRSVRNGASRSAATTSVRICRTTSARPRSSRLNLMSANLLAVEPPTADSASITWPESTATSMTASSPTPEYSTRSTCTTRPRNFGSRTSTTADFLNIPTPPARRVRAATAGHSAASSRPARRGATPPRPGAITPTLLT